MDVLFVLGGLVGLVIGGEFVVRGAVAIARSFRVSPMVIGLTLVGFGTSLPELVTSVQAAIAGSPGIAVGNVVGSNIANILLILGAAALLAPIRVLPAAFRRDGSVLVAATLICLGFILWGSLGVWAGVIFLACLAGYLGTTFYWESRHHSPAANVYEHEAETLPAMPPGRLFSFGILIAGLAVTVVGARFLVEGAIGLAQGFGVSETLIGVTIVAIGTSLPELVTSVIAARKGESDVALGNIIGSNIFNIFGILGVTAAIHPLDVPPEIAGFDIWVMVAATAVLLITAVSGWLLTRSEGGAMVAAYLTYLAYLGFSAGA